MFYKHLVEIETLIISLDELKLEDHHKKHLSQLADSTIHHTIMDLILSKLSVKDKAEFVKLYQKDPHNKELMDFLSKKVEDIEDEIKEAAKKLKEEMHEDIKESQKNRR